MKPTTSALVAAALFAAEAVFPIVHRALGARYGGFTSTHDIVIDTGLAVIWIASAVAGIVRRPPHAFFVMLVGCAVTFIHFLMYSVVTGHYGPVGASLPWLVLLPFQAYFVVCSAPAFFGQRETVESRQPARAAGSWLPPRLRHG